MAYKFSKRVPRPRPIVIGTTFLLLAAGAVIGFFIWYSLNLRPASNSQAAKLFTVDQGATTRQIASGLQSLGLIRSSTAFILYAQAHNFKNKLQAGTYKFKPSMSSQEIAESIANGYIDRNWITILPGKRLDQIKHVFADVGYSQAEISSAFETSTYTDEPLVANLPAGASLEGLLYPDSFERASDTPAKNIIKQSIEEMEAKLTPSIVSGFAAQGLNTYQGLTLASVVYQEFGDPGTEPTVAQVFLLRLKKGMMLGSDVTAFYAAALAGQGQTIGVDSPYNTRLHTGLPPGPIGSLTDTALMAVANPSKTDYLFFVAGDNGVLHFSHTDAEQQQAIKQYCTKACS